MAHEFQRATLRALLGGEELSCDFVRSEVDGIYSTYEPEWGEEPLFDMSFNPGKPVLPFPFTLDQFKAFCAWHPAFKWEVIDLGFTNSFCSWHPLFRGKASDSFSWPPDDYALLELKGRNPDSAVLVLSILGIADANEYFVCELPKFTDPSVAETMVEAPASETPESPAPPVVDAGIADGMEPDKAGPGWSLKTSIKRAPGYRWPLYNFLKAAHISGQPCPKPREVLDAWTLKPPVDVQVMPDGVKYNDGLGNPKEANLKAIQQAIQNLLRK